jgi:hypothetical protein
MEIKVPITKAELMALIYFNEPNKVNIHEIRSKILLHDNTLYIVDWGFGWITIDQYKEDKVYFVHNRNLFDGTDLLLGKHSLTVENVTSDSFNIKEDVDVLLKINSNGIVTTSVDKKAIQLNVIEW